MILEIRNYLTAIVVLFVCYVVGNLIVNLLWGFDEAYATWRGALRAMLEVCAGLVLYHTTVGSIGFLGVRHAALPPILLSVIGATSVAIVYFLVSAGGAQPFQSSWETASVIAPILGWGIYGFQSLRS